MRRPSTHDARDAEIQALGLERLVLFSDAVFAIAITLLALDIRLPDGSDGLPAAALREQLLALGPKYLSYGLSFVVIGMFWWSHHLKFRLIERYDSGLFWLNLLLLMVIAFMPFPTAVLSENGSSTATIFYALTMAAAGVLSGLLTVYVARGNRLVRAGVTRDALWQGPTQSLGIALIFLLSIPIALVDADLAKCAWLLIAPLRAVVGRASGAQRAAGACGRAVDAGR